MPKPTAARRATLAIILGAICAGCAYERTQSTPEEERRQRLQLRQVEGDIDNFTSDVGDPEGRGQIPRGR